MTDAHYGPQVPIGSGLEDASHAYAYLCDAIAEVTGNDDHDTLARDGAFLARTSQTAARLARSYADDPSESRWPQFVRCVHSAIVTLTAP
jgi:hypothetical protein